MAGLFVEIGAALKVLLEGVARTVVHIAQVFVRLERVKSAGVLVHPSSPIMLPIEEVPDKDLQNRILQYYRENWREIADKIERDLGRLGLDAECRAGLAEAMQAHECGLYRASVRAVVCEIERAIRVEVFPESTAMKVARDFLDLIGRRSSFKMSQIIFDYYAFRQCGKHIYAHMRSSEALAMASQSSFPNRHAVVHGLVPYSSEVQSLNAILMADFFLRQACELKMERQFLEGPSN